MKWYPDFCPLGACLFEIERDWSAVRKAKLCPHHQGEKGRHGLTDQQVFEAVLQTSRAKENARAAIKRERGLPREASIAYRVESNGDIVVETGVMGAAHAQALGAATTAIASTRSVPGMSRVRVE